ncbi:MAG: cytochrome b/b6 domain-containing protein [Gemmatimonadetes bacterium]|nr:cytochrome b/b6 domain-containing protein [Gemmatimonadota bacterium]
MTDHAERHFIRLSLFQRVQHWLMLGSFLALAITGLPMRFPETHWLGVVYTLVGGLAVARTIHRVSAVVMILDGVLHLGYLFHLLRKSGYDVRKAWPIIPTLKDASDWWQTSRYYWGLRPDLPPYDRFSFREKFDYFAVFWGLPVMMFSGLVLWFPVFFGNALPDLTIGIAYVMHSDEAILAISAIVVWHFYNVHYNPDKFPMSWVWWDGRISESEIRKEHPLEYERLLQEQQATAGAAPATPSTSNDPIEDPGVDR